MKALSDANFKPVRGLSNLSLFEASMTKLVAWALRGFLRDARQDFLHLAEVGGFDQMVTNPASSERCRSVSCPYPVKATNTMFLSVGC